MITSHYIRHGDATRAFMLKRLSKDILETGTDGKTILPSTPMSKAQNHSLCK